MERDAATRRRARLAGSASAAAALTLAVWVPLFIGFDPVTAVLAFCVATTAIFGTLEAATAIGRRTRTLLAEGR